MANSQLILADGEEIKGVLEGELFATSTNPLVNLYMHILKITLMIFGVREISFITVTNRRIVWETRKISCYCFEAGGTFETILPQGIASVSYAFVGTFCGCFLKKYKVAVATNSGRSIAAVVKGGKKAASDFANLMIGIVSADASSPSPSPLPPSPKPVLLQKRSAIGSDAESSPRRTIVIHRGDLAGR